MKCKNCGNENKEGAKFCRYCGSELKNENEKNRKDDFEICFDENADIDQSDIDYFDDEDNPNNRKSKLLRIVGGIAGFLMIIWIIIGIDYILDQKITVLEWIFNENQERETVLSTEKIKSNETEEKNSISNDQTYTESIEEVETQESLKEESIQQEEVHSNGETKKDKKMGNTEKESDEQKETKIEDKKGIEESETTQTNIVKNEVVINDIKYRVLNSGAELIQCNNQSNRIDLPEQIEGVPLVRIGEHAFDGCANLQYIDIPEGVTELGGYAFWDCTNIIYMVLPDSLNNVVDWALNSPNISFICHSGTFAQQYADKYARPWKEGNSLPSIQ